MLRWSTAGESHGRALIALLEGVPAGVHLTSEEVRAALAGRRAGYGRGARQKWEQDEFTVLSGFRYGVSIGSPVALEIANSEWPKWETVMSPDPVPRESLLIDAGTGDEREVARNRPLTKPRPGHADLTGMNKYGFDDARPVLEGVPRHAKLPHAWRSVPLRAPSIVRLRESTWYPTWFRSVRQKIPPDIFQLRRFRGSGRFSRAMPRSGLGPTDDRHG